MWTLATNILKLFMQLRQYRCFLNRFWILNVRWSSIQRNANLNLCSITTKILQTQGGLNIVCYNKPSLQYPCQCIYKVNDWNRENNWSITKCTLPLCLLQAKCMGLTWSSLTSTQRIENGGSRWANPSNGGLEQLVTNWNSNGKHMFFLNTYTYYSQESFKLFLTLYLTSKTSIAQTLSLNLIYFTLITKQFIQLMSVFLTCTNFQVHVLFLWEETGVPGGNPPVWLDDQLICIK